MPLETIFTALFPAEAQDFSDCADFELKFIFPQYLSLYWAIVYYRITNVPPNKTEYYNILRNIFPGIEFFLAPVLLKNTATVYVEEDRL